MCSSDCFLAVLAVLFPPLPGMTFHHVVWILISFRHLTDDTSRSLVWVKRGICSADSLISLALCCLGWVRFRSIIYWMFNFWQAYYSSPVSFTPGTSSRNTPTHGILPTYPSLMNREAPPLITIKSRLLNTPLIPAPITHAPSTNGQIPSIALSKVEPPAQQMLRTGNRNILWFSPFLHHLLPLEIDNRRGIPAMSNKLLQRHQWTALGAKEVACTSRLANHLVMLASLGAITRSRQMIRDVGEQNCRLDGEGWWVLGKNRSLISLCSLFLTFFLSFFPLGVSNFNTFLCCCSISLPLLGQMGDFNGMRMMICSMIWGLACLDMGWFF